MWAGYTADRYTTAPNSNVNIVITSKNYNSSTRELSAVINSTALANLTGQYKIHFILTENNIVYPQDCFPSCCTEGIINNYIHKWVARSVINAVTGDNLNTGSTWNQNQVITKNVSTILNTSWVAANCNLVIVVFKDSAAGMFLSSVQQTLQQSATRPIGVITLSEAAVSYRLSQNYPNPFNPKTNIEFSIPEDGTASLKIYDAVGKLVATYLDGYVKAGIYSAEIDGTSLTSGVYFYSLISGGFIETKKMILIK